MALELGRIQSRSGLTDISGRNSTMATTDPLVYVPPSQLRVTVDQV